jgi:hypothetical protein
VIAENVIAGTLSCYENVPPPTNDGRPNTVEGTTRGQCRNL